MTQPGVRWTFTPSLTTWPQLTSPQLSHPVVDVGGTVYVGASGRSFIGSPQIAIYALDGATGSVKWSQGWVAPPPVIAFIPQPALGSDGTIYAVIGSMVIAFKPDGNVKWVFSQWGVIPQSLLPATDGTVYVFNWRWVAGASQNGLFALDATGNSKWWAPFDAGMSGFLPMAVRDDGSVIVTGAHIWALEPDKTVRWKHSLSGVFAGATPAVADDGTIHVGVRPVPLTTASLLALDANGNAKAGWVTPQWGLKMPALAADGTVYLGFQFGGFSWGGAKLDARNPDGSLKWSRAIPGEVPNAPAIGNDGTIYLASGYPPSSLSTGATVYALDPATGLDRWTLGLGPLTWSSTSPAIGLDSTLFVTEASNGTLYALK
jgi:outer membrane protein assembly factor BamB